MYGGSEATRPSLDKDEKQLYLKYKNKYTKLKSQIGSAPQLLDVPQNVLFGNMSELKSEIKLAGTNKASMIAFSEKYSNYTSTFASDIVIIPNNTICNNQPGCNLFITHFRIIDIIQRNIAFLQKIKMALPSVTDPVKPILNKILINTIPTNNSIDAEFLISIGVIISKIGDGLFNKKGLTQIYIPSSVKIIGIFAFANNLLTHVNIPQNVEVIDDGAFLNNKLTRIDIPHSVITIRDLAFKNNRLTDVNIHRNVMTIGIHAFKNNPLVNVTIKRRIYDTQSNELFDNPKAINFTLLP